MHFYPEIFIIGIVTKIGMISYKQRTYLVNENMKHNIVENMKW